MATTLVRIDNDVWTAFKQHKPTYLSESGFLSQTLDNLNKGVAPTGRVNTPGFENSKGSEGTAAGHEQKAVDVRPTVEPINKEKTSKAKKPKFSPTVLDVPMELIDEHGEAIIEYWNQKGGKKTEAAWNYLIKQLELIREDAGDEALAEQIFYCTANSTQSITFANYEKFGKRQRETGAPRFDEPPSKHPAYRDASEVLRESERIAQENIERIRRERAEQEAKWPPSQTGGKGVLEPGAF